MGDADRGWWRAVGAATAGLLVCIGLARFAYAPLLPAVIARNWFAPGAAAYLGAANLLGYLAGALASRGLARRVGVRPMLRGSMAAAALSLAACCVPMPFAWFFVWRLVSGFVGGLLMIVGPSVALQLVPAARRGLAGGCIVTGVGLGIAASGTLVPLLIRWGLTEAWLGLALASAVLTVAAWRWWPEGAPPATVQGGPAGRFAPICAIYGLCAVGLSPHMVFLVDYVARGLGWGLGAGSLAWVLFGAGAVLGPLTAGRLVDKLGAERAYRVVLSAEITAVALLLQGGVVSVAVASLLGGFTVSGITAAMLGRVGVRAGADASLRTRGWTEATVAWAIGQAAGTYGMAWLYKEAGYPALLVTALSALAVAVAVELVIALNVTRRDLAMTSRPPV